MAATMLFASSYSNEIGGIAPANYVAIHVAGNAGAGIGATFNYNKDNVTITYPANTVLAEGFYKIEFVNQYVTVNGKSAEATAAEDENAHYLNAN